MLPCSALATAAAVALLAGAVFALAVEDFDLGWSGAQLLRALWYEAHLECELRTVQCSPGRVHLPCPAAEATSRRGCVPNTSSLLGTLCARHAS